MITTRFISSRAVHPSHLATCLAAALGLTHSPAHAGHRPSGPESSEDRVNSAFRLPTYLSDGSTIGRSTLAHVPGLPAGNHDVTICDDVNSPGSLRYEVANASSGDTINLAPLEFVCSTITLSSEIYVNQASLYVKGPGADKLTIDGNLHSRIFNQKFAGAARLGIYDLTLTRGKYVGSTYGFGGCIISRGEVVLSRSVVSHCVLTSDSSMAHGAAIYAGKGVVLSYSVITDNYATQTGDNLADGGGIFAHGGFHAYYSTVSNNTAVCNNFSIGGGVSASNGDVMIRGSTFYGNSADGSGAIDLQGGSSATILNSTISGNTATYGVGGIQTSMPLILANSTIAFNRALGSAYGAGLLIRDVAAYLQSSVVADNVGQNVPSDVDGATSGSIDTASAHNLIVASSTLQLPAGTIQSCPHLEPLANNGGPTQTHALRHASPAIDHGDNPAWLVSDQRLAPRVVNAIADIGAVELQPGERDERVLANGFDGFCDQ